jgi:hypothetical protein
MKYGEKLFDDGVQVRHRNSIQEDCSWDNILIGTLTENNRDKPKGQRAYAASIAAESLRKFSDEQVCKIRLMRECGMSLAKIALVFGAAKSTIHYIVK